MKNLPKVMEFYDQSWNFISFVSKFYQICIFSVAAKKLSSNLESLYFQTFSTKCPECEIRKRNGHGKSRNGNGIIREKYFVKYLGTLH